MILRQSTARTFLVGPVLDSAGAAKTDEVVGSIRITKNGTVGAADGSATLTHDHAGKYKLALTANDLDTVGIGQVSLSSGTNDMPPLSFNVVEEAVFDAFFAASAVGIPSIPANWITAAGIATGAIDADAIADNAIDAGAIATDAITSAKIATGAITSGNFAAGAITSSAFAAGAITSTVIAADAIGASELAADAVTEIQSGLATAASIAALNNLSAAQVNAEVVDALATDTYAEPGQGAPAATTSLAAKINYLFKWMRNKRTQTATTQSLYADDASTVDQKRTVSDDGTTHTVGEIASGP